MAGHARIRNGLPTVGAWLAPPAPNGSDWLPYMRDICERFWPPPAVVTLEAGRPYSSRAPRDRGLEVPGTRKFFLVSGLGRPPLLTPATPRTAAIAVDHYSGQRSPAARRATKVLSFWLARGLGGPALRGRVEVSAPSGADTIEAYLREVIAQDIRLSMYLGPARANRKPVLQLLSTTGESIAFVKIGVNPLTSELVRAEHESLTRLSQADLTDIVIPRVLHSDRWRGLDILVLSALPVWFRHHSLPSSQLVGAMSQVARAYGLRREALQGSAYLRRLRERLAGTDESAERHALLSALDDLGARAGGTVLDYGAWHGDWAPWNMANTSHGLLVWDWERFTCGVPLGFDALHHWLHTEVEARRREPLAAACDTLDRAPDLVAPFGIRGRQARLTATLYLADLATRYLADRQAKAGAQRGAPGAWLIPAIAGEVAGLPAGPGC
jgi:hypothetical protein